MHYHNFIFVDSIKKSQGRAKYTNRTLYTGKTW